MSDIKDHKKHYYIEVEGHMECIKCYAQKAIEKTNKSIVLGLEELANTKLGKSVYQDGIRQGIRESQKYISDLLEDNK